MKERILKLIALIRMLRSYYKERREKTRKLRFAEMVNDKVQVREFDGELYICYNDIPLVSAADMKKDIRFEVETSRETVMKYYDVKEVNIWR